MALRQALCDGQRWPRVYAGNFWRTYQVLNNAGTNLTFALAPIRYKSVLTVISILPYPGQEDE
jgi:hypothetical protein